MAVLLGSVKTENEKYKSLVSQRNKLYIKAFKLFPNSPVQNKVMKEIHKLNALIKKYE